MKLVLYFDVYRTAQFRDYFLRYEMEMFNLIDTKFTENIYNFYMYNLPTLYEVHEMLEDEESKATLRSYIKGMVTNSLKYYRYTSAPHYFLQGFLPEEGDIAIDGGAFDGETAIDFKMQGAKVYSFEMEPNNYKNCLKKAKEYNFVIENLGLSDKAFESFYYENTSGSHRVNEDTGLVAKFIDLDTYVVEKKIPRVDYIKLDIEGAELEMLHGAAKTISRWKPKMAVSAYHKPEDILTLPTYIKTIRPDYEFKLRHYKSSCAKDLLNDEQRKTLIKFGLGYDFALAGELVLFCK